MHSHILIPFVCLFAIASVNGALVLLTEENDFQNFFYTIGQLKAYSSLKSVFPNLYKEDLENHNVCPYKAGDRLRRYFNEAAVLSKLKQLNKPECTILYDLDNSNDANVQQRQVGASVSGCAIMKQTMNFLAKKGLMPSNAADQNEALSKLWFTEFTDVVTKKKVNAFKNIILQETAFSAVNGNKKSHLTHKPAGSKNVMKVLRSIPVTNEVEIIETKQRTLLIGLSVEMEMAMYTACYYMVPNQPCIVSLGKKDFALMTKADGAKSSGYITDGYPLLDIKLP